jgi:hypothetical protein
MLKDMSDLTFFGFAQTIFAYRTYVASIPVPEKAENNSDLLAMSLAGF